MIKKKIIILIFMFLNSCGFTPIYLNNKNINFSIEQVNYTGDRELNNFLKTILNQYKNEKVDNKIFIETSSVYKKNILNIAKVFYFVLRICFINFLSFFSFCLAR